MRTLSTVMIASSVAFAPMRVHADDDARVRTSVEVDTSQVGESGPVIQRRIRERSDVVLRREGVLPARDAQDPILMVTVFELGGEDPGYAFDLRAQRGSQNLLHTERFQCRLCTETELVSEVEARLASVVLELGTNVRAAEDTTSTAAVSSDEPSDEGVVLDARHDGRLQPMGKAGIAVLATGVVGLGVGVGLAVRKPQPQRIATRQTTTRPPGYALIGVGAALAITGGVLLALDRKRARERRSAFAPWMGPAGVGVTWSGRF